MNRLNTATELWGFLAHNKKWWLMPVVVVLLTISAVLVFASGSALAPFIYTMF